VTRHLGAFAFYLALAVAVTWPLVLDLTTSAPDLGDPLLIAWILDWGGHALTHAPLQLFHAPIYHPAPYAFAFSENMLGIALVVLPLQMASVPAMTLYNVALLVGLAFSGYGAFVLARLVTGNTAAALVAGVIHGFASFTIGHVQHLQIVWSGWLPLVLAALLVYWRTPDAKRAVLLGAAFLMNGLTSIHWLLFGGFALLVTIAFLQFAQPRRDRAFWLRLAAALLVATVLLLPVLIPYHVVAETYGARRTSFEARLGSATPLHWLVASSRNLVWGRVGDSWRMAERELFPGAMAFLLAGIAMMKLRSLAMSGALLQRRRSLDIAIITFSLIAIVTAFAGRVTVGSISFAGADVPAVLATVLLLVRLAPAVRVPNPALGAAGVWLVVGFLGSLGWNFFLHPFLFRVVTPFRATRTPARWAAIAYVGLALLAAAGAAWLIERSRRRRITAAVLLVLAVAEVAARIQWTHVPTGPDPVYAWLARARPTAVIELPMIAEGIPFLYLLAQTRHRVPLINGTSGWETPSHEQLRLMEKNLSYGQPFVDAVSRAGGEYLIVHEARLSAEQREAIAPMLAGLVPVQHFASDAVFRIPRGPADTASAPREALPR
jgi:hypothetical protein